MRLSELARDTKKLAVVYKTSANEFVLNIEYRTQAVTLGFMSELKEKRGVERITYQVENILKSWDLQDDDGKIIPITYEEIEKAGVPVYLLNSILEAIASDRFALSDESKNG